MNLHPYLKKSAPALKPELDFIIHLYLKTMNLHPYLKKSAPALKPELDFIIYRVFECQSFLQVTITDYFPRAF
jgi:hypothetical protein